MIESVAISLLALSQIVVDVLFKVRKLPIRHKHICICCAGIRSNAQDLDLLRWVFPKLKAEALERQCHIRNANKLNLKPNAAFKMLSLLGGCNLLLDRRECNQLPFKAGAVRRAAKDRDEGPTPARRRGRVRLP